MEDQLYMENTAAEKSEEFMKSLGSFKEDYGQDLYDLVKAGYEYGFMTGANIAIQKILEKINAKINSNKIL